jgi:hypothetical protein
MDLNLLFKNIPQKEDLFLQNVKKGTLVSFNYIFHKAGHDPFPNVIVTDVNPLYIRGLNIHYLTFPYIRKLLQANCSNTAFGYGTIKGDKFLVSSFRQYKRNGIRRLKVLDCDFILNLLGTVRAISPNEVEAIRQTVNEQLSKMTNQIVK